MLNVRRRLEAREEHLSPFATRSAHSRGRERAEAPSDLRTAFQRDRDRIIHTNAFRRLKHKTQVFIAPPGDHYVTRLTHTLEVTQIARTIARALNLNEDLVEAMALGHDLGHTPFGHTGEDVLDRLYSGGFRHNQQSLRVVEVLEKNGQGLNLTWEVRRGIVSHSKPRGDFLDMQDADSLTLEAQVCRISDAVAYLNHDIGDAIRAGVLAEEELPAEARELLGTRHSRRIDHMVRDIAQESWPCTGDCADPAGPPPLIGMSAPVAAVVTRLREFMFQRVYLPAGDSPEGDRARAIVEFLYDYYTRQPQAIPPEYGCRDEDPERMAVDYISGMTDNYAVQMAEALKPGISGDVFGGKI